MPHRQVRYVRPKREEQRITEHEEGSCAILGRGNEPLPDIGDSVNLC